VTRQLMAILAGVVAVAAIVAGCGSGDDATASLTKAEFVKQANAICSKGSDEINKEIQAFVKKKNAKKDAAGELTKAEISEIAATIVVPSFDAQTDQLHELGAPSGAEDEITAILDSFDKGVEVGERKPETLFNGKTNPFGDTAKKATEYGLEGCGQI